MKEVSQTDLAALLGLSTRQIRNLEGQGLPHRAEGRLKYYPIPEAIQWYAESKRQEALAELEGADYRTARGRREMARARQEEIALAKEEARVVLQEHHEEHCGRGDTLVRTALLNAPGRWGAQMGFDNPREGEAAIKRMVVEILEELSGPAADELAAGDAVALPEDFPGRRVLEAAGMETLADLLAAEDLRSIRGIGPVTEAKIQAALEELRGAA